MNFMRRLRRLTFAVLAGGAFMVGAVSVSIGFGALTPAVAQISDDAQIALEQYGMWRPHPRFGEVWVPMGVPADWRPYEYGHWVYTDEWGWYWVSDDVEADWGWVVFHYGRWAFERGTGWFWIPGDEWGPAWVNWRYGDEYAGWAPLPPDELIEPYEAEPAYWIFVPTRFVAAPRLQTYFVPVYRRPFILRQTNIVNRTVPVQGRLGVNPGISPAFIARVNGAPVATYRVRPRVFASTQGVDGAVQVRREDLRDARGGRPGGPPGGQSPGRPGAPGGAARLGAISVERTNTVIRPNAAVAAPEPLGKNERGRLGTNPPQPNIVRPTPPQPPPQQQVRPPSPPPPPPPQQQRQVQPPPPPPPQQRQVQPPPPQRQVQPPPAARPPGPPPGARPPGPPPQRPGPPPKKPPPKPGEKPPEAPR